MYGKTIEETNPQRSLLDTIITVLIGSNTSCEYQTSSSLINITILSYLRKLLL